MMRHNWSFAGSFQTHGTESTGRERGVRAVEFYDNTLTSAPDALGRFRGNALGAMRSGNILFYNNTISGYGNGPTYGLNSMRSMDNFTPWGGANGTSGWDVNDTTGGPNHDGLYWTEL